MGFGRGNDGRITGLGEFRAGILGKRAADIDVAAFQEDIGQRFIECSPAGNGEQMLPAEMPGDLDQNRVGKRLRPKQHGRGNGNVLVAGEAAYRLLRRRA